MTESVSKRSVGLFLVCLVLVSLSSMCVWAFPTLHPSLTFVAVNDGYMERGQHTGEESGDPNIAYENVWSASAADFVYNGYSTDGAAQICTIQGGWLAFDFLRLALFFDTSSVGNQSISGAVLSLCTQSSGSDVGPYSVIIQSGHGGYYFPHQPLVLTDFNRGLYSGNYGEVNSSKFLSDQYTNITITDLSLIQHNATTRMLLRLDVDVDGNHTGWSAGQSIGYHIYSSRSASPPILYLFTNIETTSSSTTSTSTHTVSATATSTITSLITYFTTTSVSQTSTTSVTSWKSTIDSSIVTVIIILTTTTKLITVNSTVTDNTTTTKLITTGSNTTLTTPYTVTDNSTATTSVTTFVTSSSTSVHDEGSGGVSPVLILYAVIIAVIVLTVYSFRKDILDLFKKYKEKGSH